MKRPNFFTRRRHPFTLIAIATVLLLIFTILPYCFSTTSSAADPSTQPTTQPTTQPATSAATDRPLHVICFGDSITGYRPHTTYQHQYLKYADLLHLMLEARLGPGQVTVENAGWAGDMTYPKKNEGWPGAAARLQKDLIDRKPDIAIVLIAGNDKVNDDASKKRTADNLNHIAKSLRDAGIRTLMLQYHAAMPDPKFKDKGWYHLDDKNDLIAAAAHAHRHPTLDMAAPMADAAKARPDLRLVDARDGVHLSPAGELVYARTIFQKLTQLGWLDQPD